LPGFVEGHAHSFLGHLWAKPYVGYFKRTRPDGSTVQGSKSVQQVVRRLKAIESDIDDPDTPLLAWGIQPIYYDEPVTAAVLDEVSSTRPIFVAHLNLHAASVNSAVIENSELPQQTSIDGVQTDANGNVTGVLSSGRAMALPGNYAISLFRGADFSEMAERFANSARNAGVTTVADLTGLDPQRARQVQRWANVTEDQNFPARVVLLGGSSRNLSHEESAKQISELAKDSTSKFRFGGVKLFLDGSIQGFTARVQWPHYYDGSPNGHWTLPSNLEDLVAILEPYHNAGLSIHCHTNGDEATKLFLDAVEQLQMESPRPEHRHTLEHNQLATTEQYERMAELGTAANIFSNHLYYYGDIHYEQTVGPTRAKQMDACKSALNAGIPFSVHSDAPVTPMDQLHTAWCAVNRVTAEGKTLGDAEQLTVKEALRAITMGGARVLKMEDEVGSIEPGKRADFAVLEEHPYRVDDWKLKDIPIWGTIVDGKSFAAQG
jgi:predicted amidohydrolase YtcJ